MHRPCAQGGMVAGGRGWHSGFMTQKLNLELRSGLPEHLRVLAEKYPRRDWYGNPNFNDLTAFWLDRHLMFRELLDRLIAGTEAFLDAETAGYGPELARYSGFLLNQLHGHHQIEDAHYFPRFQAFDTRLVQAFDLLDGDHHALDAHLHDLADQTNAVLQKLANGGAARDDAGRLLTVQQAFKGFLNRHLMDEEEIIVPIVLEYGAELE